MSLVQKITRLADPLRPGFRLFARLVWRPTQAALAWVPLTWLGLLVAGSTVLVMLFVGQEKNDRIILVSGLTILGAAAICSLCVLLTSIWLRFRPEKSAVTALDAEVGIPFQTDYRLGVVAWNPLIRFEVAWERPFVASVNMVSTPAGVREEVVAESRAMHDCIPRRLIVTDVLGLARCVVRRKTRAQVFIKPQRGNAAAIAVCQQTFTSEQLPHPDGKPLGDLIETRRYAPGDSLKLVMWKVYARTGQLLVRNAEKTAAATQKGFAYFVAADGDEPTASTARTMLEAGAFGTNLLFGTDGAERVARTDAEAVKHVVRSASKRDLGGKDLGSFLTRGAAEGILGGVLFVPPRPGAWLDQVAQALAGYRGKVQAVIGSDGVVAPIESTSGLLRRILVQRPARQAGGEHVAEVRERLERCGVTVTVVARKPTR